MVVPGWNGYVSRTLSRPRQKCNSLVYNITSYCLLFLTPRGRKKEKKRKRSLSESQFWGSKFLLWEMGWSNKTLFLQNGKTKAPYRQLLASFFSFFKAKHCWSLPKPIYISDQLFLSQTLKEKHVKPTPAPETESKMSLLEPHAYTRAWLLQLCVRAKPKAKLSQA